MCNLLNNVLYICIYQKSNIMNYILYTRTSTTDQRNGIEAQRASVARFLKSDDVIVREYTEYESGRKTNRVQLDSAIAECKAFGYTLLVARVDRLTRNYNFLHTLYINNIDFVCVDNPNANKVTIQILSALAEAEAERISSNTKLALAVVSQRLALEGKKLGTNNLTKEGVIKSATLRKQQAIKANATATEMIQLYKESNKTFEWIANRLNDKGVTTSAGGKFSKGSVKRLYDRYTSVSLPS